MNVVEFMQLSILKRKNPIYYYYFQGKSVLDVACGLGKLLEKDPENYVGIELNTELVDSCVNRGLKVVQGTCTDLSAFSDNSFDVVNCANIIEHLLPEDAAKMIFESLRVLKSGGRLLIDTPSENNVWNTFSHMKPYTPISIAKLFVRKTEGYILQNESGGGPLPVVEKVFFKGPAWGSGLVFIYMLVFSFFFNNFFIPPLCTGYVVVVRK